MTAQDRDATFFSHLKLNFDDENLIFPINTDSNGKTVFSSENEIYQNYEKIHSDDNCDIEMLKNEKGKITEYESFPSFTNSLNDGFSASNLEKKSEIRKGDDFRVLSFLERISVNISNFNITNSLNFFSDIEKNDNINNNNNNSSNSTINLLKINENENENENKNNSDKNKNENGNDGNSNNGNGNNGNSVPSSPTVKNGIYHRIEEIEEKTEINNFTDYTKQTQNNTQNNLENKILENRKNVEKSRIERNKKTLNLSKNQIDAISRFYGHTRIQEPYSENIIQTLPEFLQKYKKYFVIFMLISFTLVIFLTILMTLRNALIPETDDNPLIETEFVWSH